jgi:plastocyanin
MTAEPTPSVHTGTLLRIVAAAAIVIGGLIHLQLYFDGYRDFPNDNLGRSFLLNGIGSMVIAIALLARRDVVVRVAGLAMVVGTLIAFALSRSDRGVFGFTEKGLEPSPQSLLTIVVEIIALLAIAATFMPRVGAGRSLPVVQLAPAAAVIVIGAGVMSALWNRDPEPAPVAATPTTTIAAAPAADGSTPASTPAAGAPAAAAAPAAVTIAEFAFDPADTSIAVGSTVTWTNTDSVDHTVQSSDGSFKSEELGGSATFEYTFDTAGTFSYICGIHPSMKGTITVAG